MWEHNYLFILIVIVLAIFFARSLRKDPSKPEFPYEPSNYIFSKAERSFYGVLRQAMPEGFIVFAKVRVADALKPKRGMDRSSWQTAFNKISAKHFDFVICTSTHCRIVAVVELDDASHNSAKRVSRDEFLNGATEAAGLLLLRFKAKSSYSIQEVKEALVLLQVRADELANPRLESTRG